jgi:hypothetical protein
MPRIGYFYGESYAQVLEGIQSIMDFAYNAMVAHDQLAISPIVFVDEDSEAYQLIAKKGLAPGMAVPVRGDPKQSVYVYQVPEARAAITLLDAARTLGEDATFSDLQLNGMPLATTRSATEVNAVTTAASRKLGDNLANLSYDLSTLARMYWALIYTFKVEPMGVAPVFHGSDQYLIAAQEIGQEELTQRLMEYIQQSSGVPFGPENEEAISGMLLEQMKAQGKLFVSSAKRDDMEWVPNGSALVADKVQRAAKMQALVQNMMPALVYAHQFKPFWHAMKDWLISMDIHNFTDYLPAQSPDAMPTADQMAEFAGAMNQMRTGGGQ